MIEKRSANWHVILKLRKYLTLFSYSLCSNKNNLIYFLRQEFKTGLTKISSYLLLEPSSRVRLRNWSIFVQTLHHLSILTIVQYLYRTYVNFTATLQRSWWQRPLRKNLQPPVPKCRVVYLALLPRQKPGIVINIVSRLLLLENWFYFSNKCLVMPNVKKF